MKCHRSVTNVSIRCHKMSQTCHKRVNLVSKDVKNFPPPAGASGGACGGRQRAKLAKLAFPSPAPRSQGDVDVTEASEKCHEMSQTCHEMSQKCHEMSKKCQKHVTSMSRDVTEVSETCHEMSKKCH